MTTRCVHCNGTNVKQEASLMLDPNASHHDPIVLDDLMWEDYFYCNDCGDETEAEETEE